MTGVLLLEISVPKLQVFNGVYPYGLDGREGGGALACEIGLGVGDEIVGIANNILS
jgi:hypothetical protein